MKLTIKGLTKNYGKVCALSQFTYEFAPGIYGILGANGAGKSTLFGLLTDTVRRDSGEILWDGVDILKLGREYRAKVGYMPQVQGYYPQMTATEFLYYMGKLKGLPSKVLKQRTEHLLTEVDLSTSANQKLGHFSCGMRQRALLAQAMLGNPPLLILDEPTAGVDPYERVRIRSLIARVAQNHIVLLATHIVSDIECIANQVLLMNKGNLLKAGTAAELISTLHKVKATNFDELSDELSFDFVDKNGNEAKYVEIMDIDVDNLLEQIDNGTLEVSDPCAYWLVEGWLIAYFARVNGTDEDALISWLENDSHTVTRNSFQAFWVVVK